MKVSLAWLREHLEGETPAEALAERLTACGFNVELREPSGGDEVWEVEITANRPDALSHRGLAREAAAADCGTLRALAAEVSEGREAAAALASVTVEDAHGCPRYCARIVRGVRVGPSPAWLAERLERCGIRPINNVVDATNYVLLDVGQPLHAFDLARLDGREVRVRRALPGETLTTLDGVARALSSDDLVIADASHPVALAGVMGGADTEISADTADVLIESATFDPVTVRRTRRRLALVTEASSRFERGADRAMAPVAADLAAALIVRIAGGETAAGVLDSAPELPAPRSVGFSLRRLAAFTGCDVPVELVERVLAALELRPRIAGDTVSCTVPLHRVDLELPEDLYEEVLRHFGYDRIPAALPPLKAGPGARLGSWPLTERGRDALCAIGAAETISFSFVSLDSDRAVAASPLAARGSVVGVANPLSSRVAVMRRSLLAGLLEAMAANVRRGAARVALGEVGRVFFAEDGGVREEERLALGLAGETGAWDEARKVDFYDLKGRMATLMNLLAVDDVAWRPLADENGVLAPGAAAELVAGGRVIGVAGRVADAAADVFGVSVPAWVGEIDLAVAADARPLRYRPLDRFPSVAADLTVRHGLDMSYATLVQEIRALAPAWLETVQPVVRYRGEDVGADEVKTTVRLVYRHPERSLRQDEVNAAHFALMDALAARLGVSFT
jgi:phenylalanyl-tRNA synthetase beta chain